MILRHAFIPPDNTRLANLAGSLDEHLRTIAAAFEVRIQRRNESFRVEGAKGSEGSTGGAEEGIHPGSPEAYSSDPEGPTHAA